MSKTPTAEEFFKSSIPKYESVSKFMTDGDIFYHAKEFAKLHVQAALEAASKNVEVDYNLSERYNKTLLVDENIEVYAVASSIINAYPLTNIK